MKALTVQQPWAWAIVHGGKNVENRTQLWSYRGPLAIHAGARISERGMESPLIGEALQRLGHVVPPALDHPVLARDFGGIWGARIFTSAFLGVVDLVDVHEARMLDDESGCCDPWGEQEWHGRRHLVHLVLANPRPLERPIPCAGKLGLWTPPAEVIDELRAAL